MERNLSWSDGWGQINKVLESLKDEDDMLPMLESHIGYVLDVYYKREAHAGMLLDAASTIMNLIEANNEDDEDDDDNICDTCKSEMYEEEDLEDMINRKVKKILGFSPLYYTYTPDQDDDDEAAPTSKQHKVHMWISVSDFMEGLEKDSDITKALNQIAIKGKCEFVWDVGYWERKEKKSATEDNPTWGELFKIANRAYLDGGCVDHHFLEGFKLDSKTGKYNFFFGS
jgi:hypothetical protein